MSDQPRVPLLEVDGRPATAEQLAHFTLSNYGHFTALQVRGGATRGFALHLARLAEAGRELFGTDTDGDRVRGLVRHALEAWAGGGPRDAAVRITVFRPDGRPDPSVLVSVRPPVDLPSTPHGLLSVRYERPAAHLKHLGGFGQAYHRRRAVAAGFDEALLTDADGVVAETAVANIGFLEGDRVVWPDAPALEGIGMLVLRRELTAAGVPWLRRRVRIADLPSFDGALIVNTQGLAPVARVDEVTLPVDSPLAAAVARVFAGAPWDVI